MPEFECTVCGSSFSIREDVLARHPGWKPRYCRQHNPRRNRAGRGAAGRQAGVEEHLTLAQVLARYTAGPDTGVFTDGACIPNPGPGGWGVVWVQAGKVIAQRHGQEESATNNRMELTAIIHGLEMLPPGEPATLYTDSKLCVQTLNEWAAGWERRGWKRKGGPIQNLDLVRQAFALRRARPEVKIEHIAAHAGNRWNEYADSLATAWLREEL